MNERTNSVDTSFAHKRTYEELQDHLRELELQNQELRAKLADTERLYKQASSTADEMRKLTVELFWDLAEYRFQHDVD